MLAPTETAAYSLPAVLFPASTAFAIFVAIVVGDSPVAAITVYFCPPRV